MNIFYMIIDPTEMGLSLAAIPDPLVVIKVLLTSCIKCPAGFTNIYLVITADLALTQVYNALLVALTSTLPA